MGEAIGSGVVPFNNLQIETIPQEMIDGFDNIRNGLDFGYADDPLAFVRWHYDKRNGLFTLSMNITVFRLVIGNMQTKCGKENISQTTFTLTMPNLNQ